MVGASSPGGHMLVTSPGLWIASDNFDGSSTCAGVYGYAGICFLPHSSYGRQ
jgi:hypothetical protein